MQRHSEVAAFICHAVEAELVSHVCNLVFLIRLLGYRPHGPVTFLGVRELVSSLGQVPSQDLHQAVGIAVVVDGATLPRTPNQDQLSGC